MEEVYERMLAAILDTQVAWVGREVDNGTNPTSIMGAQLHFAIDSLGAMAGTTMVLDAEAIDAICNFYSAHVEALREKLQRLAALEAQEEADGDQA